MTGADWRGVAAGTVLATLLSPVAFLRSLLAMPLGTATALSCLGPLYEPPLDWALTGAPLRPSALLGAGLACCGVALLCL